MIELAKLYDEFPREAIHWRAQSVTNDGTKAMALAYIDARDVMDRLDSVVGPENWQDRYEETATGRVLCSISIRIGDEWITKSDGAGNTDVEGEKGALSDALKRAAVKWGIGRYLYSIPAPWVPCETYERNGKRHWKKWTEDPWKHVRGGAANDPEPKKSNGKDGPFPLGPAKNKTELKNMVREFWREVDGCGDPDELDALLKAKPNVALVNQLLKALPEWWDGNGGAYEGLEAVISRKQSELAVAALNAG
jgi:hypothetical protein